MSAVYLYLFTGILLGTLVAKHDDCRSCYEPIVFGLLWLPLLLLVLFCSWEEEP